MKRVMAACGMALILGSTLAAPARAQMDSREAIQLQNQILELKRDLQQLRGGAGSSTLGGYRASPPPAAPSGNVNDATAALLNRVLALEDQMRDLRGQIQQSDNAHTQAEQQLRKDLDDLNFKLGSGPPPARGPSQAQATPPSPVPANPAAPRRTPELAMQEGNAALARRDYPAAEAAAREVLAGPRGPRALDAQFLLAQALAGKRDYQGAAVAYDDAYSRSKTGARAQDSLLGLANSLTAIGEKKAACQALDKMRAEFPTPRADLREPITAARTRAGCR